MGNRFRWGTSSCSLRRCRSWSLRSCFNDVVNGNATFTVTSRADCRNTILKSRMIAPPVTMFAYFKPVARRGVLRVRANARWVCHRGTCHGRGGRFCLECLQNTGLGYRMRHGGSFLYGRKWWHESAGGASSRRMSGHRECGGSKRGVNAHLRGILTVASCVGKSVWGRCMRTRCEARGIITLCRACFFTGRGQR